MNAGLILRAFGENSAAAEIHELASRLAPDNEGPAGLDVKARHSASDTEHTQKPQPKPNASATSTVASEGTVVRRSKPLAEPAPGVVYFPMIGGPSSDPPRDRLGWIKAKTYDDPMAKRAIAPGFDDRVTHFSEMIGTVRSHEEDPWPSTRGLGIRSIDRLHGAKLRARRRLRRSGRTLWREGSSPHSADHRDGPHCGTIRRKVSAISGIARKWRLHSAADFPTFFLFTRPRTNAEMLRQED